MKPTVYVDILFLTNFMTDFFLLYMTRMVYKKFSPNWRLICGACLGSIYAVLMFYPRVSLLYSGICKLIVSGVIVFVSFNTKSLREFLTMLVIFYLSSFALAGITFALFYFTDMGYKIGAAMSNGIFYIDINPFHLILASILFYFAMFIGEKVYIKYFAISANMHTISISYNKKTVHIKALLDTANAMSDPITNTPVIVCSLFAVEKLFLHENFYEKLCSIRKDNSNELKLELICDTPFRLVPYRVLGNVNDVMLAFVPTKLEIDGKMYDKHVLIGISNSTLSSTSYYDALLHPRLMVTK